MSYTYLLEQGEESSAVCFSGIPAFVLSKLNLTVGKSYCNGKETGSCQDSQFGTTYEPLTEIRGEERSIPSAEGSRARTSVLKAVDSELMENGLDFGEKWVASFAKYDLDSYSWKTRQCSLFGGLEPFSETWPRWGIMQDGECWGLTMSAQYMNGSGYGLWATPTKCDYKGNHHNTTFESRKRQYQNLCGTAKLKTIYPNPSTYEVLMGWPIEWTDLKPLATGKIAEWLNSHGKY